MSESFIQYCSVSLWNERSRMAQSSCSKFSGFSLGNESAGVKVDFTTVFSFAFVEILRLESFVECREQNIVRIEMGVVVFDNGVDGDAVFPNGVDV